MACRPGTEWTGWWAVYRADEWVGGIGWPGKTLGRRMGRREFKLLSQRSTPKTVGWANLLERGVLGVAKRLGLRSMGESVVAGLGRLGRVEG